MAESNKNNPPWKNKRPKIGKEQKLSKEEIELARSRATENNRRYPNLVDNMWVIKNRNKI